MAAAGWRSSGGLHSAPAAEPTSRHTRAMSRPPATMPGCCAAAVSFANRPPDPGAVRRGLRGQHVEDHAGEAEQRAAAERDDERGELRAGRAAGRGGDAGAGRVRLGGEHRPGQERGHRDEHRAAPVERLGQRRRAGRADRDEQPVGDQREDPAVRPEQDRRLVAQQGGHQPGPSRAARRRERHRHRHASPRPSSATSTEITRTPSMARTRSTASAASAASRRMVTRSTPRRRPREPPRGAGPASTVTRPGAAEVPALVLKPRQPRRVVVHEQHGAAGRDPLCDRGVERARAPPGPGPSRPRRARAGPGRGAAPGRWPSSGTCPWTWTGPAGPRSRRRRAGRATPRRAAAPRSPRSPCTRARCSRYSRPENGSPPGNRSGTYPQCGRPVTLPADGRDTPATTRSRVDFPEPFRPVTRTSRPAGSLAEKPRTTQGWRIP